MWLSNSLGVEWIKLLIVISKISMSASEAGPFLMKGSRNLAFFSWLPRISFSVINLKRQPLIRVYFNAALNLGFSSVQDSLNSLRYFTS